jgi:hypothetical protein
MAGLRCLRDMALPEADDQIALTLRRLLPLRLRLLRRVSTASLSPSPTGVPFDRDQRTYDPPAA